MIILAFALITIVILAGVIGGMLLFVLAPTIDKIIDKVFKYNEETQTYHWFDNVYNILIKLRKCLGLRQK
jgi:ABC-type bacteriocin/lantibiotic exporter with double-glycine peptidase domain